MVEKKRLPAVKVHIAGIAKGRYVAGQGLEPHYVVTHSGRRISRVWVIGTVVAKYGIGEKKFTTVTLDDGTDTIRAKAFGSPLLDKFATGDIVEVIGRLREYNNEIYIMPEVVWKASPNHESLRELDIRAGDEEWQKKVAAIASYKNQAADLEELKRIAQEMGFSGEDVDSILESEVLAEATKDKGAVKQQLLQMITQLDRGGGCDYAELIAGAGMDEAQLDAVVQELLDEGSCFEPRPGKIKAVGG